MTDPSIEAARKALGPFGDASPFYPRSLAVAAAREALKPIREKIRELQTDIPTDDPKFGEGVDYAIAELAPLIYPTEELER